MTREERENALHCLKVMVGEEVCEECNLYGTTGTDHCEADCVRTAIEALEQEPKTEPNRCNQCKYYEGVHNVQGHAPCSFLKCGGVLWDWHCSNYEPTGAESEG